MSDAEESLEQAARKDLTPSEESAEVAAPNRPDQELPKLKPQEFRAYNFMAEQMNLYASLLRLIRIQ